MTSKQNKMPRLIVSSLSGGGGKTLVSLGLIRLLTRHGFKVKPYKKGPDYIDTSWLGFAAHTVSTNLDPFFLSPDKLSALFYETFGNADIAIIEGSRGLYDGRDKEGTYSTASLSRILNAPIILVLDCTKLTRTAAAIVAGLTCFEEVNLAGIILNHIASSRHGSIVRQAIEYHTDIPVLGEFPRLVNNPIPEKDMGLMSIYDDEGARAIEVEDIFEQLADTLQMNINVDEVIQVARNVPSLALSCSFWGEKTHRSKRPKIGYVYDAALWFYYSENLEALERAGADIVCLSLLNPKPWPEIHALYLGGGFPEIYAEALSKAKHLALIKCFSEKGMPIYAECGGFMVLCDSVQIEETTFPMAGIFPAVASYHSKPQGLGYVEAFVTNDSPFHTKGECIKGHEFHYSSCTSLGMLEHTFELMSGIGMGDTLGTGKYIDGLLTQNTFASYTHLFAPTVPNWAVRFVDAAESYAYGLVSK